VSYKYSCFSWWWARSCPKHVEKRNKHTKKNCAPSWLYLQDYTGMHGQQNVKFIYGAFRYSYYRTSEENNFRFSANCSCSWRMNTRNKGFCNVAQIMWALCCDCTHLDPVPVAVCQLPVSYLVTRTYRLYHPLIFLSKWRHSTAWLLTHSDIEFNG
jgi:hypothetical protein